MPTPKFRCKVKDRKLIFQYREKFDAYIAGFKEGDLIDLTIKKFRKRRTDPQRKYYFGVIVKILADEFGYTIDEMHEALKLKFNPKHHAKLPVGKSTKKMNTKEFMEYCDSIIRWAAMEYQVVIPDPNEIE